MVVCTSGYTAHVLAIEVNPFRILATPKGEFVADRSAFNLTTTKICAGSHEEDHAQALQHELSLLRDSRPKLFDKDAFCYDAPRLLALRSRRIKNVALLLVRGFQDGQPGWVKSHQAQGLAGFRPLDMPGYAVSDVWHDVERLHYLRYFEALDTRASVSHACQPRHKQLLDDLRKVRKWDTVEWDRLHRHFLMHEL